MQAHEEERDIYGAIYVHGKKYFLLEPRPDRTREWWMEGMNKWLVAQDAITFWNRNEETTELEIPVYTASYIVVGSDALIDLLPVPLTKKVIRFFVTDDEEA